MDELGHIKILIADDSDTDRLLLSKIVSNQGHEVVMATDGYEAINVFLQEQPQLE